MNLELEGQLHEYLGELLYQHETCYYWIEKNQLARKINALYTLLDINAEEYIWKLTEWNHTKT